MGGWQDRKRTHSSGKRYTYQSKSTLISQKPEIVTRNIALQDFKNPRSSEHHTVKLPASPEAWHTAGWHHLGMLSLLRLD